MVAYSFKQMFVDAIAAGRKQQTIRAPRRRHAAAGEELQLYTAMRTKQCRLIRRAECTEVIPVRLDLGARPEVLIGDAGCIRQYFTRPADLDHFAILDGFADWENLRGFWQREHASIEVFSGLLIRWAA